MDKSRWSPEELMVFEAYDFKCLLCSGVAYAETLHHEPPRSLNPNHKDEPWTQYPLCAYHHDKVQDMPRAEAAANLEMSQLLWYPNAIERIKERVTIPTI